MPAKDLKELIAYIKANPGKMSYGSAGHGSLNHLTGELFKLKAGITDFPHVPYRGAGPGLTDLLAGQIPALVPAMTNIVAEHHRAGKLRVLAVTHHKRLAAAPELPTAVEQGYPDIVAPNFIGLFAPAGVSKEIVSTVSAANLKLCAVKSDQEYLISGTFELEPLSSPAEYKKYVESEWCGGGRSSPRWASRSTRGRKAGHLPQKRTLGRGILQAPCHIPALTP